MLGNKIVLGSEMSNSSFFEKLIPDIKKYYLSSGLNLELSEDLSQEVFIKMLENYEDKKESKKNLRSLMYEVAKNIRNDYFRKLYRLPKLQSLDKDDYFLEPSVTIETAMIKNFEIEDMKKKLTLLSPLKQRVLELKYYSDLSYFEIAEILNLELGTVKSQIYRAKEELKILISNYDS